MVSFDEIFAFKGIIFDLDGTLVNSDPSHLLAWNEVCKKYNLPLMTLEFMQHIGGVSTANICKMYCKEHHRDDLDTDKVAKEKIEIYKQKFMLDVQMNTHISSILIKAHEKGIKTSIATGSQLPETKFLLEKHGLLDKVDAIVSSDQVKHCKPAPDTYLLAAERLGVEPKNCLVFEDTPIGLQGIKAAKMTALQVFQDKIISDFIRP